MGIGICGAVKKSRLTTILTMAAICSVFLLAMGCNSAEPAPAPTVAAPVIPAPVQIQPQPTLPPPPTEPPMEDVQPRPVSTPVVILPGSRPGLVTQFTPFPPTQEPAGPTATPPGPSPTPLTRPLVTPTSTAPPAPTAAVQNPVVIISPSSGPPGTTITVAGSNFVAGAAVGQVQFGGVSVLPSTSLTVGANGTFSVSVAVPAGAAGTYNISVVVGSDSATAQFTMLAGGASPTVPTNSPIIAKLQPLGDSLEWVAFFDNATKSWSLYDRAGTFDPKDLPGLPGAQPPQNPSDYNPLTDLRPKTPYYFYLSADAAAKLNGNDYSFTQGVNITPWR